MSVSTLPAICRLLHESSLTFICLSFSPLQSIPLLIHFQLTEMKAEQFRMENEMRSKVSQSQKQNEDIISDMQVRQTTISPHPYSINQTPSSSFHSLSSPLVKIHQT